VWSKTVNGVHDMGGMHGMGPIRNEENEPVFHSAWEGHAFALLFAAGAWGKWTLDELRHQIEKIPPAEYLRMRYYEKWTVALGELGVKSGMVTRAELEDGSPRPSAPKLTPVFTARDVGPLGIAASPAKRNVTIAARFQAGQPVHAKNMHPVGHTRLPRYARGKSGMIDRDHGVFVFPDTNAHGQGEKPQHLYSVRFAARELWGPQAAEKDSVYLDLWEYYLEPA
jgi:nitrile hydratase subunit beta